MILSVRLSHFARAAGCWCRSGAPTRADADAPASVPVPTIRVKVKFNGVYHEIYINSQASFGNPRRVHRAWRS